MLLYTLATFSTGPCATSLIIVSKHGASHRCDSYRLVLKAHLIHNLGNQLVHNAVAASGAVVHVVVVEQARLGVDLVLRFDYIFDIHCRLVGNSIIDYCLLASGK